MKKENLKNIEWEGVAFFAVILLCVVCAAAFMNFYFKAYGHPYLMDEVIDLSEGWTYETEQSKAAALETLRTGPMLQGGEKMTLYRTIADDLNEAAILIRTNHQAVNVYLDNAPLYIDKELTQGQKPGMALRFILLPKDYYGKTLKIELTSPYELYAGRTSPILMGTIPSLEAYTLSQSMRPVVLMAMCLLIGIGIIVLTFAQAVKGSLHPQNLAIGVFAVIWAFYYVCTEYITFQFFSPYWVSTLSLGLYFTFQAPLTLFFYFSFKRYKKIMLPAVILHCGFSAAAVLLQITGIMDLPRLVNVNNVLLSGLAYTAVLAILEARKKNFAMMLAAPFLTVAYVSMLYNFYVFYGRSGVVPYTYRDTYFLLLLSVLIFNIVDFFRTHYRSLRESELLAVQNRLAEENYREIKSHLHQVGGLKHEIKNHITALQLYMKQGQYKEAEAYLEQYAGFAVPIAETVYYDNFMINAVISGMMQRAGESGIKVDLKLKASPVHIAGHDFYSLLSNILENALEACEAMPGSKARFIRLSLTRREPYLNIRCENSKYGEIVSVDDRIQTSKTESGHGYGLFTIERIADAYNGIMDIAYDENTFTLTAALKDQ